MSTSKKFDNVSNPVPELTRLAPEREAQIQGWIDTRSWKPLAEILADRTRFGENEQSWVKMRLLATLIDTPSEGRGPCLRSLFFGSTSRLGSVICFQHPGFHAALLEVVPLATRLEHMKRLMDLFVLSDLPPHTILGLQRSTEESGQMSRFLLASVLEGLKQKNPAAIQIRNEYGILLMELMKPEQRTCPTPA